MPTYISMLRGINVTGHKIIRMEDLRTLYESLGYERVRSYVQSGNVVFDARTKGVETIERHIADAVKKSFGYDVSVIIRTPEELKRVLSANPFLKGRKDELPGLHVTFLSSELSPAVRKGLSVGKDGVDEYIPARREIYLSCPDGYGRTKFSNTYFEKLLTMPATTRNWKTVNALYQMALE